MKYETFDFERLRKKYIRKENTKVLKYYSKKDKDLVKISSFDISNKRISLLIDDYYLDCSDIFSKNSSKKNYYTYKKNKKVKTVFNMIIKIRKKCLKQNINIDKIVVNSKPQNYLIINELDFLLSILEYKNLNERYTYIYDQVCLELDNEFVDNNICDFKNNKCISRRDLECRECKNPLIYGCCYTKGHVCNHLINSKCDIKCLPCKLFTCRFLVKNNIKYKPNDILALNLFFNRKQKSILYNKLFTDRDEIINLLIKKNRIF